MLNEPSFNISSKSIVQEKYLSKIPASFDKKFEPIIVNSRIEGTKFELETTFEINIDEINADNVKSITSLDINLSDITSNIPSLYSGHLNENITSWIFLKSPEKLLQLTKHLSNMYLEGDTKLKIRKLWVTLRSEFYLSLFYLTFVNTSKQSASDVQNIKHSNIQLTFKKLR